MRIYLIGFMGSGKSTVGPHLAYRLGVPFLDLDSEVERRTGRAIAEIFAAEGEAGFRRAERAALFATSDTPGLVVATGGGCPVDAATRRWMRARGTVVWLDLPWPAIRRRLEASAAAARPLLWRGVEEAEALFERRLAAYRDCDLPISVRGDEHPEAVAARIFFLLGATLDPRRPRAP